MPHVEAKPLLLDSPQADACRSLALFDRLPEGFLAFAVTDHSCEPLIRRGEVAVIGLGSEFAEFAAIEDGGLYLRRSLQGDNTTRLRVHEAVSKVASVENDDGSIGEQMVWDFIAPNRPASRELWPAWSRANGPIPLADGTYRFCSRKYPFPHASILGRVVGILANAGTAPARRTR